MSESTDLKAKPACIVRAATSFGQEIGPDAVKLIAEDFCRLL